MGEVKVYLPDDLDRRFRKAAMEVYGYGRGSISKAAEEAFLEWCRKREGTSQGPEQAQATSEKTLDGQSLALQENKEDRKFEGATEPSSRPVSTG